MSKVSTKKISLIVKGIMNKPLICMLNHLVIDIALTVYAALVSRWSQLTFTILVILVFLDVLIIIYYGIQNVNYRASIETLQNVNARLLEERKSKNGSNE